MAHFEVVHCITEVSYFEKQRVVDKEGSVHMNLVNKTKKTTPGFYGVENVKVGDIIEITNPRLIGKASRNDMLKEVKDKPKKKVAKKT